MRYRLYIDESGTHGYGKAVPLNVTMGAGPSVAAANAYPDLDEPGSRYLALLGMFMESVEYRTLFQPGLENLKKKHFSYDPDEALVLHRREIVEKKSAFWPLRDPKKEEHFNDDLLELLTEHDYWLILVVIDKKAHIERYDAFAFHPYHYCVAAMMERYCGFLRYRGAVGDVMAESRMGAEDKALKQAYRRLCEEGTQFRKPEFFAGALTTKEVKLKPKSANTAGIQVCDLLAHPLKMDLLRRLKRVAPDCLEGKFGQRLVEATRPKMNRRFDTGKVSGYGEVFLG